MFDTKYLAVLDSRATTGVAAVRLVENGAPAVKPETGALIQYDRAWRSYARALERYPRVTRSACAARPNMERIRMQPPSALIGPKAKSPAYLGKRASHVTQPGASTWPVSNDA